MVFNILRLASAFPKHIMHSLHLYPCQHPYGRNIRRSSIEGFPGAGAGKPAEIRLASRPVCRLWAAEARIEVQNIAPGSTALAACAMLLLPWPAGTQEDQAAQIADPFLPALGERTQSCAAAHEACPADIFKSKCDAVLPASARTNGRTGTPVRLIWHYCRDSLRSRQERRGLFQPCARAARPRRACRRPPL